MIGERTSPIISVGPMSDESLETSWGVVRLERSPGGACTRWETRRLVRRLNELGIAHRYEEFPDNHSGVDYRMDESLPFLAQALSG
jgi:hypothetical protein